MPAKRVSAARREGALQQSRDESSVRGVSSVARILVAITGLMPWIGVLVFSVWVSIASLTLLVPQFRVSAAAQSESS